MCKYPSLFSSTRCQCFLHSLRSEYGRKLASGLPIWVETGVLLDADLGRTAESHLGISSFALVRLISTTTDYRQKLAFLHAGSTTDTLHSYSENSCSCGLP
jgi:hypothetical protein